MNKKTYEPKLENTSRIFRGEVYEIKTSKYLISNSLHTEHLYTRKNGSFFLVREDAPTPICPLTIDGARRWLDDHKFYSMILFYFPEFEDKHPAHWGNRINWKG